MFVGVSGSRLRRSALTPTPLTLGHPSGAASGRGRRSTSELAVVTLFQRIEQVGGGVHLAVVFDLLVALDLDHAAVFEFEAVGGVLEIGFLHQHALERGGVEAEGGAALEALLVGVAVDRSEE